MPDPTYLLLSSDDKPSYPTDGRCPVCGGDFQRGIAYRSGGAMLLSKDRRDSMQTKRLRGFLRVGFHGTDPDMEDSSDLEVVEDLAGGQYDLQWCSVACMRQWLLGLLQEVEVWAQPGRPTKGDGEGEPSE